MEGVLGWAHSGGIFIEPSSGRPTCLLHVFGQRWAAMAPLHLEHVTFSSSSTARLGAVLRISCIWMQTALLRLHAAFFTTIATP